MFGFPSSASDYLEERTSLIESEGNPMIDAFVPPKAKLVINWSLQAKNGDIGLQYSTEIYRKISTKNDLNTQI